MTEGKVDNGDVDGVAVMDSNREHYDRKKSVKQSEDGTFMGGYGFKKDKSVWIKFDLPVFGEIRFNPIVSVLAIVFIWTFVIICGSVPQGLPFAVWKRWIVENFTWLYIGSQDAWAVFAIVLYCSKYSKIKLGKDTDVPEYSDPTWFMMLFACGIGVGLFFYGVAEPIYHYKGPNRYTADPTIPDNTLAQIAINITLYHWGIHGWIVYSLVGLLLALLAYREDLPMTMKSCFYPLIGDRIFGWMGDLIDVISIITTLFGVCTSLGLGTRQLNTGLTLVNDSIPDNDITIQVIIIWCITAVATVSTVSGVGMGIRRLSEVCFLVGMFLMMVALFMDNTFYILNLYVQSLGFYIQKIIGLGFHTDAFEQLSPSYGGEDRNRFTADGFKPSDGPQTWMDGWTMFYWGWWISWCPFVGMFIAKISKGRTIKQFINGTLTAPIIYSFMWMVIFGGAGIKQDRAAAHAGLCCNSTGWIDTEQLNTTTGAGFLNDMIKVDEAGFVCDGGECGECANRFLAAKEHLNMTFMDMAEEFETLGEKDFGKVSGDRSLVRLTCRGTEEMWFDMMRSYPGVGNFLAGFSLIAIVLYFVTSSDSGSLVIDCLSANGDPDPPRLQRVFWAMMEGATATALLVSGGKDGLTALQTAGLLSGLPYTFLVCLICVSIWRAVKVAAGDLDPNGPEFTIGLFDSFATAPYAEISKAKGRTSASSLFVGFLKNLFMAPLTVAKVNKRLNGSKGSWIFTLGACLTFALFILFHVLELAFTSSWAIAWFFYFGFASILTAIRIQVRELMAINGNPIEDFFACLLLYPCAALQMDLTTENLDMHGDASKKKTDKNVEDGINMENKEKAANENQAYVANET